MQFETRIEDDLLHRVTAHGIRIHSVITEALWTAVKAAEAAQELGEGVEPIEDEEAAEAPLDEPYAVLKGRYSGDSYHDLMSGIRRASRKTFGRRARFTITPDGGLSIDALGAVHGVFIIEVRRAKRTS